MKIDWIYWNQLNEINFIGRPIQPSFFIQSSLPNGKIDWKKGRVDGHSAAKESRLVVNDEIDVGLLSLVGVMGGWPPWAPPKRENAAKQHQLIHETTRAQQINEWNQKNSWIVLMKWVNLWSSNGPEAGLFFFFQKKWKGNSIPSTSLFQSNKTNSQINQSTLLIELMEWIDLFCLMKGERDAHSFKLCLIIGRRPTIAPQIKQLISFHFVPFH